MRAPIRLPTRSTGLSWGSSVPDPCPHCNTTEPEMSGAPRIMRLQLCYVFGCTGSISYMQQGESTGEYATSVIPGSAATVGAIDFQRPVEMLHREHGALRSEAGRAVRVA